MRGCFVQWGMRSFAPHGMAHDAIHEINTPMMHPMEHSMGSPTVPSIEYATV